MDKLIRIWGILTAVWMVLRAYKSVFDAVGFLTRAKKFPPAAREHTYGIVIAARNEERVIGNLLDSIARQDYDPALLHVFVVADNCTDGTAEICRAHGATVYERREPEKARKGWALEFLFDNIERDFGIGSFDAYLFFDADNLLSSNFVTEINRAFDSCGDIAVGYRNTKNFDTNFISAAYGLHFFSSIMNMHRPRAFFGLSTHIAGTGYAVSSELLRDGWHWTCLTEDTQFCLTQIARGKKIVFCEAAEFFDEQPYTIPVMVRQRLRWVKGRLACFFLLAPRLIAGIFKNRGRGRISCYDMFFYIVPYAVADAVKYVLKAARYVISGILELGLPALVLVSIPGKLPGLLAAFGLTWLRMALGCAFVSLRERRHIRCSTPKLILYTLLYPFFDLTGIPIALAALFMRVKWKPIRHDRAIAISQLENEGTRK